MVFDQLSTLHALKNTEVVLDEFSHRHDSCSSGPAMSIFKLRKFIAVLALPLLVPTAHSEPGKISRWAPVIPHFAGGSLTLAGWPNSEKARISELSTDQVALEIKIAGGTFTLKHLDRYGYSRGFEGTGFMVSDTLVMTNKHVVKDLLGIDEKLLNRKLDSSTLASISMENPFLEQSYRPERVEICLENLDLCILRFKGVTGPDHAQATESETPIFPLRLKKTAYDPSENSWIGMVGNYAGKGLQASAAHFVRHLDTGVFFHCIPATLDDSGGNSGAPVYDSEGEVIGIDGYSIALDSGCKLRNKGTGLSISMVKILEDLQKESPTLYQELMTTGL
jgi:hypothetical protein